MTDDLTRLEELKIFSVKVPQICDGCIEDVLRLVAELGEQWGESSFVQREDAEVALELAVSRCFRHCLSEQKDEGANLHFRDIVRQVETILVNQAIAETSGNQVRAAALLGLNRTTLRKKMGL